MKRHTAKPIRKTVKIRKSTGPGKRTQNKERTKREILRVALALFRKKGFFRTTTKEISTKAGIAEGTLFNYFRTKEDLALFFFEQEVAGLIDWYEGESDLQTAPIAEKLFAIVHRHIERISPYEEFIGAVYLRALQPASKLNPMSLDSQAMNVRYLRFIRGILSEAEEAEEIPPVGDPGAYGFALYHVGIITYWLNDKSPGKENTLAMMDRSLNILTGTLRRGGWEW